MGMLGGLTKKTPVLMQLRKKSCTQEVKGQGSQEDSSEIGVEEQGTLSFGSRGQVFPVRYNVIGNRTNAIYAAIEDAVPIRRSRRNRGNLPEA